MDFRSPTFPMPTRASGAMNLPPSSAEGAAFYLVLGPAQGPAHPPNFPSPGITHSPLPPPYPFLPQSYPASSYQAIQGAPQPSPSYYSREPDATHVLSHSVVSGAAQISPARQRNQDDSDDEDDSVCPAMHNGDSLLAKSPPNLPFFSGGFKLPRLSRKQTLEHPVREPELPTFPCRHPECPASVRSDVAARLGGFCCDNHMWMAIHNGIATKCPRCQRVCPEGSKYCSARCANGRG